MPGGVVGIEALGDAGVGEDVADDELGTDRRRKLGATVTVATTEFTVDFLAQIWPDIAEEFTPREIQLNVAHVRTRDFWSQLDAKGVDLICGGTATREDAQRECLDAIAFALEGDRSAI